MKTVRVWFEKKDTARYISHLDLNRCMSRAFHKTKLPLWYTQGFHPHVFLTITMPLSLGMIGLRESMDIRLTEEMAGEEIIRRLNTALPLDIHVFDVTEPVMKAKDVAWASYEIVYRPENCTPQEALAKLQELFKGRLTMFLLCWRNQAPRATKTIWLRARSTTTRGKPDRKNPRVVPRQTTAATGREINMAKNRGTWLARVKDAGSMIILGQNMGITMPTAQSRAAMTMV